MRVIWKWAFDAETINIQMPIGAKVLSTAAQHNKICIWAMVDPTNQKEMRRFTVIGTGHQMDDANLVFVGTVLMANDHLVWHIFEIKK